MNATGPSDAALAAFVIREARLIDEKRLEEWYELFTEDGVYWMPLTRNQPNAQTHTSLFYEDRLLLRLRINRLSNPNSFSQAEPSWCQHVLQPPTTESRDLAANRYVLVTPFVYTESQRDRQDMYTGTAWHHLTQIDGQLRLQMKKIELLNRNAALPSMQLFL